MHLIYDCLLKIRTMVGEDNRDVLLSSILSSEILVFGFVSPVDQRDGHDKPRSVCRHLNTVVRSCCAARGETLQGTLLCLLSDTSALH